MNELVYVYVSASSIVTPRHPTPHQPTPPKPRTTPTPHPLLHKTFHDNSIWGGGCFTVYTERKELHNKAQK